MKTEPIRIYVYRVFVLCDDEVTRTFRVIAQDQAEAEQIGMDLAYLGAPPRPVLATAKRTDKPLSLTCRLLARLN